MRSSKDADYVFLQNFGKDAVQMKLPKGEVLIGNKDGRMEHLETVVVKIRR